jgi:tetratricopeptide (TPR) repeat protein
VIAALTCALCPAVVHADAQHDAEAKALYLEGKSAFDRHEYGDAYQRFKRAYMLSQRPELLFNMASALKEEGRPHDAAEALRSYLRLVPSTPDRAEIEQRILALEEANKLLEAERKPVAEPPATPPAPVLTPAPPALVETRPAPPAHKSRVGLAVGVSVGAAAVIAAVATGLALGLRSTAAPTSGSFPTVQATP